MLFWLSLAFVLTGIAGLAACFVLKSEVLRVPDELPPGFPAGGFDHATFESLLERFVTSDGTVRYQDWHEDEAAMRELDRYLAALARFSPGNAPERFATDGERRTYWIQAYNACVIKGVLAHWPLDSVQDVKAPVELKAGQGFFYNLRFVIGGEEINLYHLEHDIIRKRFTDPRIHFVLNCASEGCPVLRPDVGDLAQATRDFLAENVVVDHEKKTVTLNSIFDWYADDFEADLAREGLPESRRTVLSWLQRNAERDLKEELARADLYEVRFADYDWGVNAAR